MESREVKMSIIHALRIHPYAAAWLRFVIKMRGEAALMREDVVRDVGAPGLNR